MSKKPKKRNKPYRGEDATQQPVVRRYKAVDRSPLGEWWQDHKKAFKIGGVIAAGLFVISYIIFELIRLVF